VRWDFALWWFVLGVTGGFLGEVVVKEQIEKTGR
jgi:hypothetical protein